MGYIGILESKNTINEEIELKRIYIDWRLGIPRVLLEICSGVLFQDRGSLGYLYV